MAWDDFYRLFAEVCVCRLVPELMEGRETGWLASVFNAGQAVTLEVYARANVEVTLHQEPHASRGADAAPTLVDIGLAILKVKACLCSHFLSHLFRWCRLLHSL